jgi:hypothetical protein
MKKISSDTLWRRARSFLSVALLFALAACGSTNMPFKAVDEQKAFKPTTIAVISGSDRDGDMQLAKFITKGLTERTAFHVLPQEEIEKRLPDYPLQIAVRRDVKEEESKPTWFQPSEKRKLDAIQAKLKVDYLFVIWNFSTTLITSQRSSTYYVHPIGNMIEYPGSKVVASTMSVADSSISPLALFRPNDYYIVDALKDASEDIVDDFIATTKSKKQ